MIVSDLYASALEIVGACTAARSLAPSDFPPDLPTSKLLSGAPGWYDFEEQTWPIGEAIHRSLKAKPALRRDESITRSLVSVVNCVNLRRGRQSFAMALGYTTASQHAPDIARYLADQDICGHALDALIMMQAAGYEVAASPLAHHHHAWIRRLANRYLDRYGVQAR